MNLFGLGGVGSALAVPKKALFDNTHAETAGNADWQIDTDQPVPVPAQSTITWATSRTIWLGANSSWAVDLVKRGYQVATLTTAYGITYHNAGNLYDLSNYDVFIINEPNTRFTSAESTAIFNYVRDGGGLVAVCDHAGSDRNNDKVDSPMAWGRLDRSHLWGAHFDSTGEANNSISQISTNADTSPSNPVVHGVNGVGDGLAFNAGTTMQLYPAVNPSVQGDIWMNGLAHGNSGVMAAHSTYGSGRIFFVGDSSPIDDGSAAPGNSSIFDGWGDASGRDSLIVMNGTMWVTRQSTDTTAPLVTTTAPNGGEVWAMASAHSITWTATDNVSVASVNLEYSTNNGGSWTAIATGLANSGSYAWTVPSTATTQALVRVTALDGAGNSANDVSNAVFTIADQTLPVVTVTSPNGAENWAAGSIHNITWTATDNVGVTSVTLEYSTNNGGSYVAIASGLANSGSYAWTLPVVVSTQARVRVKALDAAANTGSDASNAVFTISDQTPPTATLTSPQGGETWAAGSTHDITWTATDNIGVASITLEYSLNDGNTWLPVASGLANSGTYAWTVPTQPTTLARVRVTAFDAATLFTRDPSNAAFAITDQSGPTATLLGPNGGEMWAAGSTHDVTWTATDNLGVTSVNIDYSLDGGGSWASAGAGLPNSGTWAWTLPEALSAQALVRVTAYDAAANPGASTSAAVFAIVDQTLPTVHVTSPNGGESWTVGDVHGIAWNATDNIAVASVDLAYSKDAGATWTPIAAGEANDGLFDWTVPQDVTSLALVRLTARDAAGNAARDSSDAVFTIAAQIGVPFLPAVLAGPVLLQNRPNPFRSPTRIGFGLPASGPVRLAVYALDGHLVRMLADGDFPAGYSEVTWDGRSDAGLAQPSGVYFYRFEAGGVVETRRLVLSK